jgi:hypothetical protein
MSHSRSELRELFQKVKDAIEPFAQFADGRLLGTGDVSGELDGLLIERYERYPLSVLPRHVQVQRDSPRGEVISIDTSVLVTLSSTLLMNVADSLSRTLADIDTTLRADEQSKVKGIAPGLALHDFLWRIREWAESAHHPISPYKSISKSDSLRDKEASPFSHFVFALNAMLSSVSVPKTAKAADGTRIVSLAESVKSPEAMAHRIKVIATEMKAWRARGGDSSA